MTFIPTQIGAAAVFRLEGAFGAGADFSALDAAVGNLPGDQVRAVFFDLARVTRLDCTGIGEFIRLRHRVTANGWNFGLVNVTPRQQRLLDLAHLSAVLGVQRLGDGASARSSVGPSSGGIGLSLLGFVARPRHARAIRRARLAVG
jgi:anti-anti-sigma factor